MRNFDFELSKDNGFACGHLMILVHSDSIGNKRFMETLVPIDLDGFHMR